MSLVGNKKNKVYSDLTKKENATFFQKSMNVTRRHVERIKFVLT